MICQMADVSGRLKVKLSGPWYKEHKEYAAEVD